MIEFTKRRIWNIDASSMPLLETLTALRTLTIDEFGELMVSLPNEDLPHLSRILPGMIAEDIQQEWTGSTGMTLLAQSINFMNFVSSSF